MYPTLECDLVGVLLQDKDGSLSKELKEHIKKYGYRRKPLLVKIVSKSKTNGKGNR